jgi:hypothetical protein
MLAIAIVAAVLAGPSAAQAADPVTYDARYRGCRSRACDARVLRRKRRQAWARRHPWETYRTRLYERHPGLKTRLANLRGCETRGLAYPANYRQDGHHKGAYQYDYGTWRETLAYLPRHLQRSAHPGGNASDARPVEQDVRTAVFFPTHTGRWACVA